jgi:membrane-associated protease RseP (regulator of RpoE activity)
MLFLGVHEFGHYFAARAWNMQVTLPYFIPAPILPIGTFGAVIKMKSSIPSRRALIDVGASGPLAGFFVAVAATVVGLSKSTIVPAAQMSESVGFTLGESLIFKGLAYLTLGPLPEEAGLVLHPIAFAGWIGLFVTALNLLPFGQLDGGHVLFALSPRTHQLLRHIRIPLLLLMGLTFWSGWFVWAVFLFFLGKRHPYPDRMDGAVGTVRTVIAVIAILIFIGSVMPTPIAVE